MQKFVQSIRSLFSGGDEASRDPAPPHSSFTRFVEAVDQHNKWFVETIPSAAKRLTEVWDSGHVSSVVSANRSAARELLRAIETDLQTIGGVATHLDPRVRGELLREIYTQLGVWAASDERRLQGCDLFLTIGRMQKEDLFREVLNETRSDFRWNITRWGESRIVYAITGTIFPLAELSLLSINIEQSIRLEDLSDKDWAFLSRHVDREPTARDAVFEIAVSLEIVGGNVERADLKGLRFDAISAEFGQAKVSDEARTECRELAEFGLHGDLTLRPCVFEGCTLGDLDISNLVYVEVHESVVDGRFRAQCIGSLQVANSHFRGEARFNKCGSLHGGNATNIEKSWIIGSRWRDCVLPYACFLDCRLEDSDWDATDYIEGAVFTGSDLTGAKGLLFDGNNLRDVNFGPHAEIPWLSIVRNYTGAALFFNMFVVLAFFLPLLAKVVAAAGAGVLQQAESGMSSALHACLDPSIDCARTTAGLAAIGAHEEVLLLTGMSLFLLLFNFNRYRITRRAVSFFEDQKLSGHAPLLVEPVRKYDLLSRLSRLWKEASRAALGQPRSYRWIIKHDRANAPLSAIALVFAAYHLGDWLLTPLFFATAPAP